MRRASVLGVGMYVPETVVTNADLEVWIDTSDEWIRTRTGIRERRIVGGTHQATSDLALEAARGALRDAHTAPEDIDLIIVATCTGDYPLPATASLLQAALGAKQAGAYDLNAACCGFIYALATATHAIAAGCGQRVLVVGAEVMSRFLNWQDRATCVLFGDGAGAVVLGPAAEEGSGFLRFYLRTDGTLKDHLLIPAGGSRRPLDEQVLQQGLHTIHMDGRPIFRFAVTAMHEAIREVLAGTPYRCSDLRWIFAHQANLRILHAAADLLAVPRERFWVDIFRYGNTSAASIPISLTEAWQQGQLQAGDLVALVAVGAGASWAAALLRWEGRRGV